MRLEELSLREIHCRVCLPWLLLRQDVSWWKGSNQREKAGVRRDSVRSDNRCKMLWDQLNALQTWKKKRKQELNQWHLGLLSNVMSSQKKSTALWSSEATVLLICCSSSGWYYWSRQIKGLERFWQVDKCCLTRQSTGQTVRCPPDQIDSLSLCD